MCSVYAKLSFPTCLLYAVFCCLSRTHCALDLCTALNACCVKALLPHLFFSCSWSLSVWYHWQSFVSVLLIPICTGLWWKCPDCTTTHHSLQCGSPALTNKRCCQMFYPRTLIKGGLVTKSKMPFIAPACPNVVLQPDVSEASVISAPRLHKWAVKE